MKKILILAAAVAVLCSCGNKNKYTIEGSVAGANEMVYLFDSEKNVIDSAAVKEGKFRLTGVVEMPDLCYLIDAREEGSTFGTMLLLEPGTITIADNPEGHRKLVAGTPANDANTAYTAAGNALIMEFRDEATSDERREAIEKEYDQLTRTTMEQNRGNIFGALLAQELGYELSGQELLDEIALFPEELQQGNVLRTLRENAENKLRTEVGQPYTDIAQPDAAGQEVSLKSVVENPANKYVLLDFWASWCGPCMGEVPHLKKTYDEFHKKGFEIYGVSFDKDREKWLAAVDQNGMNWVHVSEVNGFDNQAARDYAVQSIPANFLIGSDGTIVAKNLRGEALYEKIEELLGE